MAYRKNDIHEGMKVYTADGARLGKVINLTDDGFYVEKGVFFPKDYAFTYSEIGDIRDEKLYLNIDERTFREGGPTMEEQKTKPSAGATGTREEVRVPLSEEHIDVSKRTEEVGRVRVSKETITEEETVRVPVSRERVRVEHVPAEKGQKVPAEGTFQEEAVEVPVYEEHAEVSKHPEVKEEVRIGKEHYREEEIHREPVRKERAVVEEETTEPERRMGELEDTEAKYQAPPLSPDDR